MLGQGFVKVLKWRDPKRLLPRNPQTHVPTNLAVKPCPVQHSPRCRNLKVWRALTVALGSVRAEGHFLHGQVNFSGCSITGSLGGE